MSGLFRGFASESFAFFRELARNNNKLWFDRNRERYEAHVSGAFRELLIALEPSLLKLNPNFETSGKTNQNFSRINRDIRFSKDKSPYKSNYYLYVYDRRCSRDQDGRLYVGLSADCVTVGFSIYAPWGKGPKGALDNVFRPRVQKDGARLRRLVDAVVRKRRYETYWHRQEKGDWVLHPGLPKKDEDWLTLQAWIVRKVFEPGARGLDSPAFAKQVAKIFTDLYPLYVFASTGGGGRKDALALDRAEDTSKKLLSYGRVRSRLKRAGKLQQHAQQAPTLSSLVLALALHAFPWMGSPLEAVKAPQQAAEQEDTENSRPGALHLMKGRELMAKKRWPDAEKEFRLALGFEPDNPEMHFSLADVLERIGRIDDAIAEYRRVLALSPELAEAHSRLGFLLYGKQELDQAIAEYREALGIRPKDAVTTNDLGLALYDKGRVDDAMAEFHQAIVLDPQYALAHTNLGVALSSKGDHAAAIQEFRLSLQFDPDDPITHNGLGAALEKTGDLDGAIVEYRVARRLDPHYTDAAFNLGNALRLTGDLDGAVAQLQAVVDERPQDAGAHYSLGTVLESKGSADEAMAEFQKAIELNPKHVEAHNHLGVILHKKDRLSEAVEQYIAAINLQPDSGEFHQNLGAALQQQGHIQQALAAYQRACQLGFQESCKRIGRTRQSKQQK